MINAIDRLSGVLGRLLVVALLSGVYATAAAHTALESSNPVDGAVVSKAPEQLQLRFTASVALVRFAITDGADKALKLDFSPSTEAKTEYLMAIPALQTGNYKVDWAVIGADGHTVANSFSFVVDPTAMAGHAEHGAEGHGHSAADASHGAHGDAGHDH